MTTLTSEQNDVNACEPYYINEAAVASGLAKLIGHPPENAPKPKRRTVRSLYRDIDVHRSKAEAWPTTMPALTEVEAKAAGKRLYRAFMKRPWTGAVVATSGNRNTWVRRGVDQTDG
jgi:hypothetical protein